MKAPRRKKAINRAAGDPLGSLSDLFQLPSLQELIATWAGEPDDFEALFASREPDDFQLLFGAVEMQICISCRILIIAVPQCLDPRVNHSALRFVQMPALIDLTG